jgi:glycosyltransferase involved in cell wall biosynthesis
MRGIKILYLIDKLEVGGTQRHLAQLACGLDRGVFEPAVCCLQRLGPIGGGIAAKGVPVDCLGLKRIYGLRARFALRKLVGDIVRDGTDVVHCYLPSANLFGTRAARRAGVRAIASKRDMGFEDGRVQRFASRWVNRHADVVTANSQAVARHVLEEGGTTGDKIRVIYNGVPDECFRMPERSAAEAIAGVARDGERRRVLGREASRTVEEKFSIDRMVRQMEELYQCSN